MKSVILSVPDMACDGCVKTVEDALTRVCGVRRASVSLDEKRALVEVDDGVAAADLASAVAAAGYTASVEEERAA
jgi:copper chaperone CopZ